MNSSQFFLPLTVSIPPRHLSSFGTLGVVLLGPFLPSPFRFGFTDTSGRLHTPLASQHFETVSFTALKVQSLVFQAVLVRCYLPKYLKAQLAAALRVMVP